MPSLAEIQSEFARALADSDLPAPRPVRPAAPAGPSRRFDVYRNNRAVGLVEALQSGFPAVRRLVGDEYFNAAARAYIDAHPPRSPVLLRYGESFAEFVESLPSAAGVPYLGDVARLEWLRRRALHAADAEPAGIECLGEVPESRMNDVTFALHPSLAVLASRWPFVSLWSAALDPDSAGTVDMKEAERVMIVRPALQVVMHKLPAAGDVFVGALSRGATLGDAARQALGAGERFDLAGQLQLLFQTGAVTAVNLTEKQRTS